MLRRRCAEAGRVAKTVLIGAVPPVIARTGSNPDGIPLEVFDGFRSALVANRAQFFHDIPSGPFFGFNRDGATVRQGRSGTGGVRARVPRRSATASRRSRKPTSPTI